MNSSSQAWSECKYESYHSCQGFLPAAVVPFPTSPCTGLPSLLLKTGDAVLHRGVKNQGQFFPVILKTSQRSLSNKDKKININKTCNSLLLPLMSVRGHSRVHPRFKAVRNSLCLVTKVAKIISQRHGYRKGKNWG